MGFNNPTISDFKTYFARDFQFGTTSDKVMDSDIMTAFFTADTSINVGLFTSEGYFQRGFLLLAAHHLVTSLQASSQGVAGQYTWLQNSRSVGSVSESVSIPPRIANNPLFAFYAKTNYGMQYLAMILPALTGVMYNVTGRTLA